MSTDTVKSPVERTGKISIPEVRNESTMFNPQKQNFMTKKEELQDPLKVILQEAEPIDFREEAQIGEKGKITKKHYIVYVIKAVLAIAQKVKLGLCMFQDNVYVYNGMFWDRIDDEAFLLFLGKCAEKMGVEYVDANYYENMDGFFKQFSRMGYMKNPNNGKQSLAINLMNGTYEISTELQRLREFRPDDFMTYQLPFEYDPYAKCPLFMQYLNRVLPDKQSQRVIAEFFGSIFIDNTILKLEKILMPYGAGANGKSVLFEIMNALFGTENVSNFDLDGLTDSKGYDRAMLTDKLLNYSSEISNKINAERFKKLASGEPLTARHPYGRPFQISKYPKLVVNVNELPRVTEHSHGYFRRFLIIPFEEHIPEHEQDKQLATKIIREELAGVFNWILEGLERLLENKGFTDCEKSEKALNRYKLDADNVGLFLDENGYKPHPDLFELAKPLFQDYRSFCQTDGYMPMSMSKFRRRLESKGISVKRQSDNTYRVYITNVDSTKFPF